MKTLNILFLGGAKRVSVARHLKEYGQSIGYVVNIFSYELGDKLPIASVGKIIVGLKWSDKNLISDLQRVIKDKNINVVLPFVDPAILVASRLKELCPDVFIPVSGKDICEIMFDKLLSARWFKNNSIPQPDFFEKVEDIAADILKVVIEDGKGIELNTSWHRYGLDGPTPSLGILKLYRDLGGRIITLGSDSHRPSQLTKGIKEDMELLKSLGYKEFCTFDKLVPIFHKL